MNPVVLVLIAIGAIIQIGVIAWAVTSSLPMSWLVGGILVGFAFEMFGLAQHAKQQD